MLPNHFSQMQTDSSVEFDFSSAFGGQEKEIVKIQAFLKANKAREDYRILSE